MSWTDEAQARLRQAGFRAGQARTSVIEYLDAQSCCRGAGEIHAALGERVGLASVYRVLDTLVEHDLVQRVDVGDGVARFEPFGGDEEHHHHLVCDDCGRVEPFTDAPLEQALVRAAGRLGYAMEQHEVVLRGTCHECA